MMNMKKTAYHPPVMEYVSLEVEQVLAKGFSQIELPDHDWTKGKPIEVFPEKV